MSEPVGKAIKRLRDMVSSTAISKEQVIEQLDAITQINNQKRARIDDDDEMQHAAAAASSVPIHHAAAAAMQEYKQGDVVMNLDASWLGIVTSAGRARVQCTRLSKRDGGVIITSVDPAVLRLATPSERRSVTRIKIQSAIDAKAADDAAMELSFQTQTDRLSALYVKKDEARERQRLRDLRNQQRRMRNIDRRARGESSSATSSDSSDDELLVSNTPRVPAAQEATKKDHRRQRESTLIAKAKSHLDAQHRLKVGDRVITIGQFGTKAVITRVTAKRVTASCIDNYGQVRSFTTDGREFRMPTALELASGAWDAIDAALR